MTEFSRGRPQRPINISRIEEISDEQTYGKVKAHLARLAKLGEEDLF